MCRVLGQQCNSVGNERVELSKMAVFYHVSGVLGQWEGGSKVVAGSMRSPFGTDSAYHQCHAMSSYQMKSKVVVVLYAMSGMAIQWEGESGEGHWGTLKVLLKSRLVPRWMLDLASGDEGFRPTKRCCGSNNGGGLLLGKGLGRCGSIRSLSLSSVLCRSVLIGLIWCISSSSLRLC